MATPLHALIVEDSERDVALVVRQLEHAGYDLHWERVDSAADLDTALQRKEWDVVLCDYRMPGFSGDEALAMVRDTDRDLPFIFVSGTMGEDVAIDALKAGANDYVLKNSLKRLVPAVERALREVALLRERQRAERGRELTLEVLRLLNRSQTKSDTIRDILLALKTWTGVEAVAIRLREGEDYPYYESHGFPEHFLKTESPLCVRDAEGGIVHDSCGLPVMECMCGNVIAGRTDPSLPFFTRGGSFWTNSTTELLASMKEQQQPQGVMRNRCNREGYESVALIPLKCDSNIIGLLQLNDRRKGRFNLDMIGLLEGVTASIGVAIARQTAKEQRQSLAEQLRQSQKLEAVGQLAGGVAHDFRNQLTIIQGFTELLQEGRHAPADSKHMFSEIHKAIGRSTTLVAQLMAFSRKQTLTAKLADVNQVIGELAGILPKLLGEDHRLVIVPASNPCMAVLDVGQLHQAIVNLANNARDAMPHGGTLTIATGLVPAGDPLIRTQPGIPDRDYIAIHVRDTGTGMDEAMCARIFEPFFTTKPVGEGTGLGLAMVHGFIYQSGGFITVDSKPGAGTEFHLYLPRTEAQDPAPVVAAETAMSPLPPASGTILVVEDAESLRMAAVLSLSRQGYTVHGAESPAAALELLHRNGVVPDLLVTDLVMPGGSGLDLAQAVLRLHPQVGILYMSGYAEKDLSARGLKEVPGAFLPKPFGLRQLSDAVRTALAGRGSQPVPANG